MERNQKENNEKEVCAEIINENEKDVISPSQPKKARRSRSRKKSGQQPREEEERISVAVPYPAKDM